MNATATETSTSVPLKLWVVMSRAYDAIRRNVEAQIASEGLTTTEFGILEVLHHKGPLLLGEIQRKVLVTSGGTTYLVDRLAEKGLVKREECPSDRRARYAVLTTEGSELIGRVFPKHAQALRKILSGLTREEQLEATKLMKKLGLAADALMNE